MSSENEFKDLVTRSGMKQVALAEKMGRPYVTVKSWCQGVYKADPAAVRKMRKVTKYIDKVFRG